MMSRLSETEFVEKIFLEAVPLSKMDEKEANEEATDEHQFYVQRVGFALAHMLTWCQQLGLAVELMMNFDYSKRMSGSRGHHLVFCVENYLIRLSSVYDRVLHLVNTVFHLCVNEEHVSHSVVISNYKVQHRPEIVSRIKAIKKYLDEYSQARHTLVHRHSLPDTKLRRIELFYMHEPKVLYPDTKEAARFKTLRARYVRDYAVKKKDEFLVINGELENLLAVLFGELLKEYGRQREEFRKRGL